MKEHNTEEHSFNLKTFTVKDIISKLSKYKDNQAVFVIDEDFYGRWCIDKIISKDGAIYIRIFPYVLNDQSIKQKMGTVNIPKKKFTLGDNVRANESLALELVKENRKKPNWKRMLKW